MHKTEIITKKAREIIKFLLAFLLVFNLGISSSFAADTGGNTVGGTAGAGSDSGAGIAAGVGASIVTGAETGAGTGAAYTPYNINGGTTGVFSRKQLPFAGFDGSQADVTLPYVTLGQKGDCPYVYFGFDWPDDKGNAEGGFQFVEDEQNPGYNKWTVFMRQGNDWRWGDNILLEQGSTHHLKFYAVKVSDTKTDLVIDLDGKEVIRKTSVVNNFNEASVKSVVAMAMSVPFDGANCPSTSIDCKITNTTVSENSSDDYIDIGYYNLYSEYRNGIWYGTADCIPEYLHYRDDGTVSIYRSSVDQAEENQFKVVGYYSGSLFDEPIEKLQTDKLTHIIYAFLIPQEDGSLAQLEKPDQLRALVARAHHDGAKVLIALGGWSYQGQPLVTVFESVAADHEKRAMLVENVHRFVEEYDLDGVELDWEHPNQNSIGNYDKLVVDLKAALDKDGKELTAALNGAWSTTAGPEVSKLMTDVSLESFSFINVMAYDMNNAEHSPLWFADTSINYWLNRGVPAEEIILGMPLYARPSWKQYRHLAAENPEYAYIDHVAGEPLESWYNGLNTLREKTYIAMKKAGGVMLFDVNEDTDDETSVVSMIHELQGRTKGYSNEELGKYIAVILNNRELVFLPEEGLGVPFIDANSRTMIPFKKPMEAIGAVVTYDAENRTVTAVKEDITVMLTIGEKEIFVNGEMTAMDTEAVIKGDRTYIPLTAVFNALRYDVIWHGSSNTVYVTKRKS